MSFYLDDYPDDDHNTSAQTCPHCSGISFYNDPVTGALTCSSCYTQSQTATQEELDYDEGIGLAAKGGKRTYNAGAGGAGRRGVGRAGRSLTEYDGSRRLPDAEGCCLAFQWLLWDASKCVSKLAGIHEIHAHDDAHHSNRNGNGGPSVMERTVKRIWFAYLHTWMEATREYSAKYPEMRVSFRDYFLGGAQKNHLMRHLSVTVGKRVEDEILEEIRAEMRQKYRENPHHTDDDDEEKSLSSTDHASSFSDGSSDGSTARPASDRQPAAKRDKRARRPLLTIAQLCKHTLPSNPKRHPNGIYQMHPHQAVLKIQPSLTLLLSILQLALTHLRAGVAPHHLTRWVANGQLPHGLNGYARLPTRHKERIEMVKKFFMRSFVPPAGVVADSTDMLATACWYGEEMADNKPLITTVPRTDLSNKWTTMRQVHSPAQNSDTRHSSEMPDVSFTKGYVTHSVASDKSNATAVKDGYHQKSLYNVPLLAARMVQDFGLDQRVLDNTMTLMGVERGCSAEDDNDRRTKSRDGSVDQRDGHRVKLNNTLASLKCAAPDKLYTPVHVAAVIILACKRCPGWETWKITNLYTAPNTSNSDSNLPSQPAFVPWNESQFQLLGNGPTLNYYLDFLEETAFCGVESSTSANRFFQSLKSDTDEHVFVGKNVERTVPANKAKITPCIILAGGSNPNDPRALLNPSISTTSAHAQYNTANSNGRGTDNCKSRMCQDSTTLDIDSHHPHYFRLLEYVCFVIEETNTGKLHDMIEEFELSYHNHASHARLHPQQRRNSTKSKNEHAKTPKKRKIS